MALIYEENQPKTFRGGFDISKINPNNPYRTHLANYYYLLFISTKSDNFKERQQANQELQICQRKLQFWYRQPSFDINVAAQDTAAQKKQWQTDAEPVATTTQTKR